ncbi:MAG TPA: hypothetical protein VF669_15220, partial [Tepidisphaeraceae bacterium]
AFESDPTLKVTSWKVVRVDLGAIDPGTIAREAKGVLKITGTGLSENISVSLRPRDGRVVARVGDVSRTFSRTQIRKIVINGQAGDDQIVIGAGVMGVSVDGGDGDDSILGGEGADYLGGGWGKDSISGGGGNDLLFGGAAMDRIRGGAGRDVTQKDLLDRVEKDVEVVG